MSIDTLENTDPQAMQNSLFEFPEYGILPFRPCDLHQDEKDQILYQLEDENKTLRKLMIKVFDAA